MTSLRCVWLSTFLAILLSGQAASAQSQPAGEFNFSNLVAGIRTSPDGRYKADDFAFSFVNPTSSAITVNATLTATDANFQFQKCASRGTYTYDPSFTLEKINDPLQSLVSAYAPNVL